MNRGDISHRGGMVEAVIYVSVMRAYLPTILLLVLAINTLWFVIYSANLGLRGLAAQNPEDVARVYFAQTPFANAALAVHMIAGGLLTVGAPLQALPVLRRRWSWVHRRSGYVLFGLSVATGLGGFVYIATNGTIGGAWMSLWFAIYGAALVWSALATVYHARRNDRARHFEWAVRLVILAVGSWIYRMHYGIWYAMTGGLGSNSDFTGLFDKVQVFAFFVPYLLIAEAILWRRRAKRRSCKTVTLG